RLDPRFVDNELVTGPLHLRFYAGAPLITPGGFGLGALCVMDTEPRRLDPGQIVALRALGNQIVCNLEMRRLVRLILNQAELLAALRPRIHDITRRMPHPAA